MELLHKISFSFLFLIGLVLVDCGHNKVRLTDITTLTLQKGQMTTGRRSSGVAQLQCIYGGTVDCSEIYLPSVQCYNRGSNGLDVQWECKADMDANYRFGHVEVNCEGFDYPDDPYVLAGSCGLEYNVNYVKDSTGGGWKKPGGMDYGASGGSGRGWVLMIGGAIVIYAIYKTCIVGPTARAADARSRTNDEYPDEGRRPPPPGFRTDYFNSAPNHSSCGGTGTHSSSGARGGAGTGAGGFWTGAATGGLLGYMFGARNTGNTGGYFGGTRTNTGGWGSPQPSTSSGFTRSTSGFGGTRRR